MLRRNNVFDNGINLPVESLCFKVRIVIIAQGEHCKHRVSK